jgi:hypothetical protein
MPPLKAHKDIIACGKIGGEVKLLGICHEVAWFWGVGALKTGVNFWPSEGHLSLPCQVQISTSKYTS